jgi:HK97 family phage major capsid protein
MKERQMTDIDNLRNRQDYLNAIQALENKADDLMNLGRPLQGHEQGLLNQIRDKVQHLKMQMPQQAMTVQGPQNSTTRTNGTGFASLGEQLRAVAQAGTPGGRVDNRLFNAAGMNETTPSEGGFLLSQDFSADLLYGVFGQGTLPSLCNRFQIQSNSIKLPAVDESSRVDGSRWGGITSYWLGEGAQITSSTPKFRALELTLKKLGILSYASDELLSDTAVLERVIRQAFMDELSFKLNNAIVRGSGAGQPLGILNSDALVTVDKETGQDDGTLVLQNITKMWSRMLPRSRQNAVWLINTDIETELYQLSLAVGVGGLPVFMPSGGASASPYSTLFGRPIMPCESCSTLGTKGDIILADLGGYILAEKSTGPEVASSIHVRFEYDEQAFRLIYRCDGQPMLSEPITPAQGTNSLSHFVALADR